MKLITFDFWNTLFLDRHEEVRHTKRIAFAYRTLRKYRNALELSEVEKAFRVAHQLFLSQWEDRRSFTMNRHFGKMLQVIGLEISNPDFDQVVDYFETILLEYPPALICNAQQAVRFASSRMKVGLISDTGYTPGRILRRILERHGLQFHAFSFSNETGYLKPNPETFAVILKELNIPPQEAVHVGDLEDTDIAGAKQIGMRAIKFIGANPFANRESAADAVIQDLSELPEAIRGM